MLEKFSIRTKLAVFVALLVCGMGILNASLVLWQEHKDQLEELHSNAITSVILFQHALVDPLRLEDDYQIYQLLSSPFANEEKGLSVSGRSLKNIVLLDDAGIVISSSDPEHCPLNSEFARDNREFSQSLGLLPALDLKDTATFVEHADESGFYVLAPVGENGVKYANLLLDYSVKPLQENFQTKITNFISIIAITAVVLTLLAQLLARYLTQPLQKLNRDVHTISNRHALGIGESIWVKDELRLLTKAFDQLNDALNHAEELRDQSAQREKLALAGLEHSTQGIFIADLEGNIIYANSAFERNTSYSRHEVIGQNPRILKSGKTPKETYAALWGALKQGKHWQGELINRRKDGSEYTELVTISPIRLNETDVSHFLAVQEDITERLAAEAQIRHQAEHDALTGLPNRVLLEDRMGQAIKSASRSGEKLALMFLDLDHFKKVNDLLGHHVGDQLLNAVAERLVDSVRLSDTVCRLGGDEFVVLLSPVNGTAEAQGVAAKIVKTLLAPYKMSDDRMINTSVSIGIAIYPEHGSSTDELTRNADIAMYQAKESGRNHYRLYSPEMHSSLHERVTLEDDLKTAIQQNQFILHYQPQYSTQSGEICGLEALIRWQHPQRGLIYPDGFIERAENSGQIVEIGTWVIQEACRHVRKWLDAGLQVPIVAVNVSFRQFHQQSLGAVIRDALQINELTGNNLEIELTESVMLSDPENVYTILRNLRAMGVKISIDDFGTGYSSLHYLKRLDVDTLKIDRSFIIDMQTPDGYALVETIIAIAKTLKLHTIAEGVETVEQLEILRRLGCQEIQGYLFSKPLPLDAVITLLQSHNTRGSKTA